MEEKKKKTNTVKVYYRLAVADGSKVVIDSESASAPAVKFDDFVNTDVTVTGEATVKETDGKKSIRFEKVTAVKKADVAAK